MYEWNFIFQPESSPLEESVKEWKPVSQHGASVLEIESGSAAEEAGLKIGDVILQVDETVVRSSDDVARAVNKSNDLFVMLRVDRAIGRRRGSMVMRQSVRDVGDLKF